MTTLLIGHTLADDAPVGPMLRDLGQLAAANAAEAGHLDVCLRQLDYPAPLREVARLWPAALRESQRRLDALPSPLIFQLPMLQTFGYIGLIGLLQLGTLSLLRGKILPMFAQLSAETGAVLPLGGLTAAPWLLVALVILMPTGVMLAARRGWGWAGHYARARQAAVAAGMAEAGAPAEARRQLAASLPRISEEGASAEELDLVTARALARAEQSHSQTVAAVRLIGIGGLFAVAAAVTASIYQTLSMISVPV